MFTIKLKKICNRLIMSMLHYTQTIKFRLPITNIILFTCHVRSACRRLNVTLVTDIRVSYSTFITETNFLVDGVYNGISQYTNTTIFPQQL